MTLLARPFTDARGQVCAGVSALAHFNSLHGIAGRAWLAKYQQVTSASGFIKNFHTQQNYATAQ